MRIVAVVLCECFCPMVCIVKSTQRHDFRLRIAVSGGVPSPFRGHSSPGPRKRKSVSSARRDNFLLAAFDIFAKLPVCRFRASRQPHHSFHFFSRCLFVADTAVTNSSGTCCYASRRNFEGAINYYVVATRGVGLITPRPVAARFSYILAVAIFFLIFRRVFASLLHLRSD